MVIARRAEILACAALLALGEPRPALAEASLEAALALTATTDRRAALERLVERGATPRERAIAGLRLAELLVLLAEPAAARQVLSGADRSLLDRDDRRSFDRLSQLR